MSPIFRVIFALGFGLTSFFVLRNNPRFLRGNNSKVGALSLPLAVCIWLALPLFFSFGIPSARLSSVFLPICYAIFALFLNILFFDLLLLLFLPWLRKRVSPYTCAFLWFFPSLLFSLLSMLINRSSPYRPIFFFRVEASVFRIIVWVWLAGFLLFLGWQVLSHLRFRRRVLRDATEADGRTLQILQELRGELHIKARGELVFSSCVSAPLSIGILDRTLRIVLPKNSRYTDEELRLVLRHELFHIDNGDNQFKFTMAFISAFGWFLPTQWLGLRKAAEDLELRCDQQAAEGLSQEAVRQYAGLILNNAGTAKGFTTCLSTSAEGLRYRLNRILHPGKQGSGAVFTGIAVAVFFLTIGLFSLAPGGTTLTQTVREAKPSAVVEKMDVHTSDGKRDLLYCCDSDGLLEALEALRLYRLPMYSSGSLPRDFLDPPYLQINLEHGGWIAIHNDEARGQSYVSITANDTVYLTDRMIDPAALLPYFETQAADASGSK